MGWEYRKKNLYYYRKTWCGGTCRSEYIGTGAMAELIAEVDALCHERRQQEATRRQLARSDFDELAHTPEELIKLVTEARRAATEALLAAGYHQHKRQWRKKRHAKEED